MLDRMWMLPSGGRFQDAGDGEVESSWSRMQSDK